MARARNIKPAFFQNETLAELLPIERLAFIGMWTIADFKGCIEYRPKRLKVQLLPYDDCNFETIAINLDKSGFISIYSVQGQKYIKILNFEKHQNPHKNEREAGSEIPDISEKDNEIKEMIKDGTCTDLIGTTRADSLNPLTDSLNPLAKTPSRKIALDDGFEEFWNIYPKKVSKEYARKAWIKAKPKIDDVLKSLTWQVKQDQWLKDKGQFIPNPSTYINQARWLDEMPREVVPF